MMNRLQFSIDIKAEKAKIWNALWNENSYRDWAGVFYEGSYVVTNNWEEGSKVQFLSAEKNGIYSIVETHVPNETMQFRHVGNVLQGVEQPIDDESKAWSGATETYTIVEGVDDNHILNVEIDVLNEHLDFMTKTFPKALERVKNNCS